MFKAVYDVTLAQLNFEAWIAAGWRAVSLSMWLVPDQAADLSLGGTPRFAVVWKGGNDVKPTPPQQMFVGGVEVIGLANFGANAELIAVASMNGQTTYAVVLRGSSPIPSLVTLDIPVDLFERFIDRGKATPPPPPPTKDVDDLRRLFPISACMYEAGVGDYRIAAVTREKAPGAYGPIRYTGFHVSKVGDTQKAIGAFRKHPALVPMALQPFFSHSKYIVAPESFMLWWEGSIGEWEPIWGLSGSGFENAKAEQSLLGRQPIRMHGMFDLKTGSTRYGVVFAKADLFLPRAFHVRTTGKKIASPSGPVSADPPGMPGSPAPPPGPVPIVPIGKSFAEAVHALMLQKMQYYDVRNAHIAIGRKGRLVLAAGYTWAEDGYPIVTPTTRTMVASVSKVFAKISILQAVSYGAAADSIGLLSPIYPILRRRDKVSACRTDALNGDEITSAAFKTEVNIHRLLNHTAGLPHNTTDIRSYVHQANLDLAAQAVPKCAPTKEWVPFSIEQAERAYYTAYKSNLGLGSDTYTDISHVLLARAVEVVGRMPGGVSTVPADYEFSEGIFEDVSARASIMDPLMVPPEQFALHSSQPNPIEAFLPDTGTQRLLPSQTSEGELTLSSYGNFGLSSGANGVSITMAALARVLLSLDVDPCPILPPAAIGFLGLPSFAYMAMFQFPDENGQLVDTMTHGGNARGSFGGVLRRLDGGWTIAVFFNRFPMPSLKGTAFALNDLVNAAVKDGTLPQEDVFPEVGMPSLVP